MGADTLSADEVVVEAEYIHVINHDPPSLPKLHEQLLTQMELEGFVPEDRRKLALNSQAVSYIRDMDRPTKTLTWKVKNWLNLTDEADLNRNNYIWNLRRMRDDLTFRLRFRIVPISFEETEGYSIDVRAEPALYHKHQQISHREDFSSQNAVRSAKEKLEDIAVNMGWETWREPRTKTETLRETVNDQMRERLESTKYGEYVVELADEGDEALRYQLLHPALSSYIHAIEWAIICYREDAYGDDLIEEEITGEFGYNYGQLIEEELPTDAPITQKTKEELSAFVTYRRWIAHHKSGKLTEHNVGTVKDRLRILLEELYI